jgi:hypothetical protein
MMVVECDRDWRRHRRARSAPLVLLPPPVVTLAIVGDGDKGTFCTLRTMAFSSFFPSKLLPTSVNPRDRSSDSLSSLRFALETMPGSRKYMFTPSTRAEILTELYDAFWGPYSYLFLPQSYATLQPNETLGEAQARIGYNGAGRQSQVLPGRPCGHILGKGESCFRCRYVARAVDSPPRIIHLNST